MICCKKIKVFCSFLILFFCINSSIFSFDNKAPDKEIYTQALSYVRQGDKDFAFMYFDMLVRVYPNSPFSQSALFVLGEYYFENKSYREARDYFSRFLAYYPDSPAALFVYCYLLDIAKRGQNQDLIEDMEESILTYKQFTLLFSDYSECKYKSLLNNEYKALYYIDRVDIYINENLFETVYF